MKKKKKKRRSAVAVAAILKTGAGKHSDKRFKRNKKKRKYNPFDGW